MKNLSTAQRLIVHLNTKGKEYYADIITETNRVLATNNKSNSNKEK